MPYIKYNQRARFDKVLEELGQAIPENPGELNYLISEILAVCWANSDNNYQAINDIMGALEGAKLEFYRRIAAPYEDGKIKENGDVY